MKRRYKGWFGTHARRRCPHSGLIGVYGDEIDNCGGFRLYCEDCDRFLDGPVLLASNRYVERGTREGVNNTIEYDSRNVFFNPGPVEPYFPHIDYTMDDIRKSILKRKEEENAKDATRGDNSSQV